MSALEERVLIYAAVAVICAFGGVFLGPWIVVMTFLQIVAVIEALYWFGLPRTDTYRPREHRTLFH
ncbi:hypothetical protein EYC98_12005 [Halieaceae bacterium IMCC14734]|uniref:Phosphatidate cytidylyltransferase n=1 Tax=Candidatus Litorirhabdus singularis TaxID=2518993 RepID=A0ABT3TIL6_9GAMM|nr:hypothetical protein [Candidatus Litorirhabdus singularis]MCX2981586.1 hypothetical protein [Candidatus Litorirhabdus singularis]